MWNRTLATVLCTFCRPHLPKVLRHHQFFKKTILKCKSSSCHGPVHVFDDGWLTWWYGCHDETWTWWQDCPWTFVRNSEVYNYSLSSTTLCWLAELRSFSFLKFKTYQVDEGWGQQIEVIDYSCKLVHGEQRTPPALSLMDFIRCGWNQPSLTGLLKMSLTEHESERPLLQNHILPWSNTLRADSDTVYTVNICELRCVCEVQLEYCRENEKANIRSMKGLRRHFATTP